MISSSKDLSVLIAGYDQYSVLAAVRALRAAGYTTWLAASERGTYAEKSLATAGTEWVPDPTVDGEGFVRGLAATAERLSVTAVLPSMETHPLTLAGREADFSGTALGVLLGRRPDVGGYRVGVRFRQEEKDLRALTRLLLTARGWHRRRAIRACLPQRYATHAVLSSRDPMPVLVSVEKLSQWLKSGITSRSTLRNLGRRLS